MPTDQCLWLSAPSGFCYPQHLPFPVATPFAYLPGSPDYYTAFCLGATLLFQNFLPLDPGSFLCPGTALQTSERY